MENPVPDQLHPKVTGQFGANLEGPTTTLPTNANLSNRRTSFDGRVRNRSIPFRSKRLRPTDINNNQTRVIIHPANPVPSHLHRNHMSSLWHLPPVSTCFGVFLLFIYFSREDLFNIKKDEDVYVSWKTVVTQGEIWRLFCAQFFHFSRIFMFFSFVSFMSTGRFLEQKIKKPAYLFLVIFTSVASNLLYIFINDIFCSGPQTEYTIGIGTTIFALRMIHVFVMDSDAHNGKGDPNLIFGFFPVYLPTAIAPWQPLIETIIFDVAILGRCVASNVSGMCTGLMFPYLMKHYRNYIMLPRNPPGPPPRTRSFRPPSRRPSQSSNSSNGDSNRNNNDNNNNS